MTDQPVYVPEPEICTRITAALERLGYPAPVMGETRVDEAMGMVVTALEDISRTWRRIDPYEPTFNLFSDD